MNVNSFLPCISVVGINTGVSVLGLYSSNSGDTGLLYNQLASVHRISGFPYSPSLPLIFNGSGNNPSGSLSGSSVGFYQVGVGFNQNFTTLVYFQYSGCRNNSTKNRVLVATTPYGATQSSGVFLSLTPSNRLNVSTSGYAYTLPQEVGVGDFAYLSVISGGFLSFGLYSTSEGTLYSKDYNMPAPTLYGDSLCYGGGLTFASDFTGFSGKINDVMLFSGRLLSPSIYTCVDCDFTTGYSIATGNQVFTQSSVTGSSWSGVYVTQATGTGYYRSGAYPRTGTSSGTYVYLDMQSGSVLSGETLVPMLQTTTGTGYFLSYVFQYNNAQRASGYLSDLYFDVPLQSGDMVEIYTYPVANTGLGLSIGNFQNPTGSIQLYGNGLAETSGVDYLVNFNNLISGFSDGETLLYDKVSGMVTMPYTTGYVSTGVTSLNSYINITGASGVSFARPFQYDIYFNGQKMISGNDYVVNNTGTSGVSIYSAFAGAYNYAFFDILSGNSLELKFVPIQSGVIATRSGIVAASNYISGISGFSEQVWVNGIRQAEGVDYWIQARCRFCPDFYAPPDLPFTVYNSSRSQFSFEPLRVGLVAFYP